MRIGILGGGAIGMHLSAQLFMAGEQVTLICRTKEQAEQLSREGLTYQTYKGSHKQLFIPVQSTEITVPFDLLLITLKQTHLEEASPILKEIAKLGTSFLCFQNGLGHDEFFLREFPNVPLFLAVTTEGALKVNTTTVKHTGKGKTWIGGSAQGESEERVEKLIQLFLRSEMQVEQAEDIYHRMWKKLLINACINPLTAIFKVRNGQLLETAASSFLVKEIFFEARAVAQSQGIELEENFLEEIFSVCKNTYHNKSSMLQDLEAGRITEIDYINGALKRIAEKIGMSVPCNSMLIEMVHAMEEWSRIDRDL